MQAILCQKILLGLTKCSDLSDLCATSATTASACPVGSDQTSTADDDPNQAQCPELPLDATCSAFVGEHGNPSRTCICFLSSCACTECNNLFYTGECNGAQACNARVSEAEFVDNGNSDNTVGVCVNYTAAGSPCTTGYGKISHTSPASLFPLDTHLSPLLGLKAFTPLHPVLLHPSGSCSVDCSLCMCCLWSW